MFQGQTQGSTSFSCSFISSQSKPLHRATSTTQEKFFKLIFGWTMAWSWLQIAGMLGFSSSIDSHGNSTNAVFLLCSKASQTCAGLLWIILFLAVSQNQTHSLRVLLKNSTSGLAWRLLSRLLSPTASTNYFNTCWLLSTITPPKMPFPLSAISLQHSSSRLGVNICHNQKERTRTPRKM